MREEALWGWTNYPSMSPTVEQLVQSKDLMEVELWLQNGGCLCQDFEDCPLNNPDFWDLQSNEVSISFESDEEKDDKWELRYWLNVFKKYMC